MENFVYKLLNVLGYYSIGVISIWIVNAFAAGYNGGTATKEDFYSSVLWPVSIAATIGMLTKVIVDSIKDAANTASKKSKKKK